MFNCTRIFLLDNVSGLCLFRLFATVLIFLPGLRLESHFHFAFFGAESTTTVAKAAIDGARFPDTSRQPLAAKFIGLAQWNIAVQPRSQEQKTQQKPQEKQQDKQKSPQPQGEQETPAGGEPQAKKLKLSVQPLEIKLKSQQQDQDKKGDAAGAVDPTAPAKERNQLEGLTSNFRQTKATPHLFWLPAPARQQGPPGSTAAVAGRR